MRRPQAFTLIELLVVIAIIAVLAALLFPMFARARRSARSTHCISNLRQLGASMQQYVEDYDGRFPWAYDLYSVHLLQKRPALRQTMTAYVSTDQLWRCPDDIGETFPLGPFGYRHRTPPFFSDRMGFQSYGWRGVNWQGGGSPAYYRQELGGKPVSVVKWPAISPLLWDTRPWHGNYRPDENYFESPALYNMLYCDGHIERNAQAEWDANLRRSIR